MNLFERSRQRMVDDLRMRGIDDEQVLQALRDVPRHCFVDEALAAVAYQHDALPIGQGQTISQPYIVARMTQLLQLQGHERVLEIGTGCGYQTAVLSRLCKRVYSIERIESLADRARSNLRKTHHSNVMLKHGDGLQGWSEYAPFDRIIATAGGFSSDLWMEQLNDGGFILLPESIDGIHRLVRRQKHGASFTEEYFDACVFVPLLAGIDHL